MRRLPTRRDGARPDGVCCGEWPSGDPQENHSARVDHLHLRQPHFYPASSVNYFEPSTSSRLLPIMIEQNKHKQTVTKRETTSSLAPSPPMRALRLLICAYFASILLASSISIVANAQVNRAVDSYDSLAGEPRQRTLERPAERDDDDELQTTSSPQLFRHHIERSHNYADHYHQQHKHHNRRHKNRRHTGRQHHHVIYTNQDQRSPDASPERQAEDGNGDSGIDNVLESNRFWARHVFDNNINAEDKNKADHLMSVIDDDFVASLDDDNAQSSEDVNDQFERPRVDQRRRLNKHGLSNIFHNHQHRHGDNYIHRSTSASTTHSPAEFLDKDFNDEHPQGDGNSWSQTDDKRTLPRPRYHHSKHHTNNIDFDDHLSPKSGQQHKLNHHVPEQAPIVVSSSDNSYVSASPIVIDMNENISTTATTTGGSLRSSSSESISGSNSGSNDIIYESDQFRDSTRFGNFRRAPVDVNTIRASDTRHATESNNFNHFYPEQSPQRHYIDTNPADKLYTMSGEPQQELAQSNIETRLSTTLKDDLQLDSTTAESFYEDDGGGTLNLKRTAADEHPKSSYSHIVQNSGNQLSFGAKRYWHDSHIANIQIEQEDPHSLNHRSTNSALIAIMFGIGATGMLIMIVGHKMRSIRRRVAYKGRRRSLVPDTDFLINTIPI